jgi:hypothetical protein
MVDIEAGHQRVMRRFPKIMARLGEGASMTDPNDLDKRLTDLAFRLAGDDRFTVLEAASRLRQWEAWRVRVKQQLDLL